MRPQVGIVLKNGTVCSVLPRSTEVGSQLFDDEAEEDPRQWIFGQIRAEVHPASERSTGADENAFVLEVETPTPSFTIHSATCLENAIVGKEEALNATLQSGIEIGRCGKVEQLLCSKGPKRLTGGSVRSSCPDRLNFGTPKKTWSSVVEQCDGSRPLGAS